MSFDIALWPRSGILDLVAVRAWLGSQPNWILADASAEYRNDDTGAYFVLDIDPDAASAGEPPLVAAINVYRPSFFGPEAAARIGELTSAFDLLLGVFEDRAHAVEFSFEWLVAQWSDANSSAYATFAARGMEQPRMPGAKLTAAWVWNYQRASRQESLTEDIFVPVIMAFRMAEGVALPSSGRVRSP